MKPNCGGIIESGPALFGSSNRRSPRMAPNASIFAVSPNTGFVFGAYLKPNRDPLNLVQGKG